MPPIKKETPSELRTRELRLASVPLHERPRMRFKLLAGKHLGPDLDQEPTVIRNPNTGEVSLKYPSRTWKTGEVVESATDLVKKHGGEKFRQLGVKPRAANSLVSAAQTRQVVKEPDHQHRDTKDKSEAERLHGLPAPPGIQPVDEDEVEAEDGAVSEDDLQTMSVRDLRALAEERGVDLTGANRKDQIIGRILSGPVVGQVSDGEPDESEDEDNE